MNFVIISSLIMWILGVSKQEIFYISLDSVTWQFEASKMIQKNWMDGSIKTNANYSFEQ